MHTQILEPCDHVDCVGNVAQFGWSRLTDPSLQHKPRPPTAIPHSAGSVPKTQVTSMQGATNSHCKIRDSCDLFGQLIVGAVLLLVEASEAERPAEALITLKPLAGGPQ